MSIRGSTTCHTLCACRQPCRLAVRLRCIVSLSSAADMKLKPGQRMGWGVHFDKAARSRPDFDPRAEQLVLCYVTINTNIAHLQVMLQPAGGFFPVVLLNQCCELGVYVCVWAGGWGGVQTDDTVLFDVFILIK